MKRLALHTWTLDTTPLAEVLRIARETGWDAVELRRLDVVRTVEAGGTRASVVDLVGNAGVPVACVGAEPGWMLADGVERARLFAVFAEQCALARALGCDTVMSPVDKGRGDEDRAVASLREAADIATRHRVRLALEFNSQAALWNRLEVARALLARAAHPGCGLLLDTYHLYRSGGTPKDLEDVSPGEIGYVQYSDVPASGVRPGMVLDRLPPGRGVVPFGELFAVLAEKKYAGYASYEAPNPEAWDRPAAEVAREALVATRAITPRR